MDTNTSLPLVDRLQLVAGLWTEVSGASFARLGKAAIGDGAFFDRLGERGPTTSTLERFARFLADAANWPNGEVPNEAVAFAHVTGVTAAASGASPGNGPAVSPAERDAA